MDLHPIFVHFPVALITLFAVLEILPFEKKFGKTYFFTKFGFLFFGVLMAFPAYMTGGIAGESVEHGPMGQILQVHAFFAGASIFIAALLFVVYLVRFGLEQKDSIIGRYVARFVPEKILLAFKPLTAKGFVVFASIVLLVCITITGALGGSMVYGPGVDPIAKMLYKVFGL